MDKLAELRFILCIIESSLGPGVVVVGFVQYFPTVTLHARVFKQFCEFSRQILNCRKMSHSVTITRTTVASSGTAVFVNTGYFSTLPGLLKLAQLLLGAACVGVVGYYVDHSTSDSRVVMRKAELFYLLVATAFLIGTFCIVVSCLSSLSSATMIARTIYEVVYHGIAFILYLCAGLTLIIIVNDKHYSYYYGKQYEAYLAAAIMGLVMAGLYLLSTFLANRHYRGV